VRSTLRPITEELSLSISWFNDPTLSALAEELTRVHALLDDPAFFAPFVPFFDPGMGRPSTPMETHLRLMLLNFRYRLGYEALCRGVPIYRLRKTR
jgi:IS5 family transposase